MKSESFAAADLSDAWIDGDATARWRSAAGATGDGSGTSLLELAPGCRLPRHTDSAEETIVVVAGEAEVEVGSERERLRAGGAALVPRAVAHEARTAGDEPLRFVALYAANEVGTTYEQPVQPAGD